MFRHLQQPELGPNRPARNGYKLKFGALAEVVERIQHLVAVAEVERMPQDFFWPQTLARRLASQSVLVELRSLDPRMETMVETPRLEHT